MLNSAANSVLSQELDSSSSPQDMSGTPDYERTELASAINRATEFLSVRQLPTGGFPVEMTTYSDGIPVVEPDEALFAAAHVVYSLGFVQSTIAKSMITKALSYFQAEMTGRGVWRHWNKSSTRGSRRLFPFIPADLDDMSNISFLLTRHGIKFPDNRTLFLNNRDRNGLYYTWLMLRPKISLSPTYLMTVLSEFNIPRFTIFWKVTEAGYLDVDGVVNANVLLYLGDGKETAPVVDWLTEVVRNGSEAKCDKWYRDIFTFHYALSRTHGGGRKPFDHLSEFIVQRLIATAGPDGVLGENVLHTALAANTFMNFCSQPSQLAAAIKAIISQQSEDGSWPSAPYYYGGPLKVAHWGSRELTTALCVEALVRYARL